VVVNIVEFVQNCKHINPLFAVSLWSM